MADDVKTECQAGKVKRMVYEVKRLRSLYLTTVKAKNIRGNLVEFVQDSFVR